MTPSAADEAFTFPSVRGYGERLRKARESAGLSVDQVAQQLKLGPRQIEAIEAEDLENLPEIAYVRGFVRNYARLLGLDARSLLEVVPEATLEPEKGATFRRPSGRMAELPRESASAKGIGRWLIPLLLVGLIVAFAGYEWLRQERARAGESEDQSPPAAELPTDAQTLTPVQPTPLPLAPGQPGASGTTDPAGNTTGSDSKAAVGTGLATGDSPSAGGTTTSAGTGSKGGSPATAPEGGGSFADGADKAKVAEGGTATPSPPTTPEVRLTFDQPSWVELRDSTGRLLLSQTSPAGSTRVVTGDPPFSVVIGNAAGVRLTYNGQQVDLGPHIRANIARLSLP